MSGIMAMLLGRVAAAGGTLSIVQIQIRIGNMLVAVVLEALEPVLVWLSQRELITPLPLALVVLVVMV